MKVIVLGGGVNALGIVRSLGETGHRATVFAKGEGPQRGIDFSSRYVEKVHFVKDEEDIIGVLLKEYGNESTPTPILCAGDAEACLLDRHYDELKGRFCFFNAGAAGRISHFMDKVNTFPLAERNGLTLIKTWHLKGGDPLPEVLPYPCIIKSANSTTSTKGVMFICANEDELRAVIREGVDYLLQDYMKKDYEYELNVVGFSYDHGNHVYLPAAIRKIRDEIRRQSVYIRLDDIRDYPLLDLAGIRQFIKDLGYEGIFSVELIFSGGKYYFLEVNLRNDGCGYLYTKGGVNYPALWVEYAKGTLREETLANLKARTPLYLMQLYDVYNVLEGKVGFWRWIWEGVTADAYFTWNLRDPMPFIASSLVHLRQACKKIGRFARRRG